MTTNKGKTTGAISLQLTDDERDRLQKAAGERGMSAFIRDRLFGQDTRATQIRVPTSNARQLAHILAALGQSEISANLRSLHEAARSGSLPVDEEARSALFDACRTVERIRTDLMSALGLNEGADE
ncbi:MAG: hypothetical protein ABI398_08835 [Devosia sp.]